MSSTVKNNICFRILIPVFNPPESLADYLQAIKDPDESLLENLILIDDGSTNGVVENLKDRFPEIEVLRGDGNLWWAGGMKVGMVRALELNVDAVVWLNHDCTPDPGAIRGLASLAAQEGTGAVSGWCYCREDSAFGVSPGFRNFKEITKDELEGGGLITVDGVNGNCTAISAASIRAVGFPETEFHPHYGDGPYTWRLHQGGFINKVCPKFRAALDREFERCVDEGGHSMIWDTPLFEKLRYYWFSNRSKFHWRHRFHDLRVFRGFPKAIIFYPLVQMKLFWRVFRGHLQRKAPLEERIDSLLTRYQSRFPGAPLRRDLTKLAQRSK